MIHIVDRTGINARETNIAVGVISNLGYYPARYTATTGTQWSYAAAIPVGVSVRLFIDTLLKVNDQSGQPVAVRAAG